MKKRHILFPFLFLAFFNATPASALGGESMPGGAPIPLMLNPVYNPHKVPAGVYPQALGPLAATASFTINYVAAGSSNSMNDTCTSWPAGAQAAFSYAASIWSNIIVSSVPITIQACWTNLDPGVLGHARTEGFFRDFTNAPAANVWYPVALANAFNGADLDPAKNDMSIAYSGNGIDWYFGTDGNPGYAIDFVSVVLHEMAHGLGFAGSMTINGSGQGTWGFLTGFPVSYDRFTENGSNQSLTNVTLFPNPSDALATQLTSNNIYFDGPYTTAANGTPAKLYAPSPWEPGSSYAHLDEIFNNTPNALMTYAADFGESNHDPGPVGLAVLKDAGWIATSVCTYAITPSSKTFTSAGGSGTVSVTAGTGCAWTASESLDWVTITGGNSGTGNGTVSYTVSANAGVTRSGNMTIAGKTFMITQSADAGSLGDGVDNTGLTFTTGGGAPWFSQTLVSFAGGDAAQSGAIGSNQTSWMETTVNGPATLSFHWKVSSEVGFDYLNLYIDSVWQDGISGESGWQQYVWRFGSGSHTIKWEYQKDDLVSSGADAAWVDRVRVQPVSIWTAGAGTSNWHTATNWDSAAVPSSTIDAIITASLQNPVISSSASVLDLIIESGSSLTLNSNLRVYGTLFVEGTLTANAQLLIQN